MLRILQNSFETVQLLLCLCTSLLFSFERSDSILYLKSDASAIWQMSVFNYETDFRHLEMVTFRYLTTYLGGGQLKSAFLYYRTIAPLEQTQVAVLTGAAQPLVDTMDLKAWPRISLIGARARNCTPSTPLFPPHFPSLPPRQGKIFEEVSLSRPVTHSPLYWRREEPHLGKLKRTKRVFAAVLCHFFGTKVLLFSGQTESSRQPWDGTCGLRLACPLWSALTPILQRISCWPCLPGTRPQKVWNPLSFSFMWWCTPLFLFWPHPPFSVINFGPLRQERIACHTPPYPLSSSAVQNLHACTQPN